jgi:alpha-mannosidase
VQSPNDVANSFQARRYNVRALYESLPVMGYRTLRVVPVERSQRLLQPKTMLSAPQTMENEFLKVSMNANATLDVFDKRSGRLYAGLGYFRDNGETGDPWNLIPPQNDVLYTTLNERARITLIRDGELECAFRATLDWALPESRSADEKTRSERLCPYTITNTVKLRKGEPWVEIETEVHNSVRDHYLQVAFPSGVKADHVQAQSQFDVALPSH